MYVCVRLNHILGGLLESGLFRMTPDDKGKVKTPGLLLVFVDYTATTDNLGLG